MIDARMKLLLDLVSAEATKWESLESDAPIKIVGDVHVSYEQRYGFNVWVPSRHSAGVTPSEFGDTAEYQTAKKALARQANEARAMPDVLALRQLAFKDPK